MDTLWNEVLWSQFGASIDMLGDAISGCPNNLWRLSMWKDPQMPPEFSQFWYVAYPTLFWLDLYLTGTVEGFTPPEPFDLNELDPQGLLPGRVFDSIELLSYLAHCRQKCKETLENMDEEQVHRLCYFPWRKGGLIFIELLLDNMRHVQEHAAQLHMFLGQEASLPSGWISKVRGNDSAG